MAIIEPFEWTRQLGDGPVSLTEPQLSEVMHHLMALGSERYNAVGHGMKSSGTALEVSISRYSLTDPKPAGLPDVFVFKVGTSVTFAVIAAIEPDGAAARAWDDVFAEALQRLGRSEREFEWTAVIGVLPDRGVRGPALEEAVTIGRLDLHPCSEPYFEYDDSAVYSYGKLGMGGQLAHSWPVVVRGWARGYTWQGSADADAAAQLSSLCALLTLAFDVLWSVRDSPLPRDVLDRVGAAWKVPPGPAQAFRDHDASDVQRTAYRVSTWVIDAWPRFAEGVLEAAEMHREGVSLTSAHPSFALVAFVSAIESVAIITKDATRCGECNQIKGSGARFRAAMATVLDHEQVEIFSTAYDQRSRTAHSSKLHGEEGQRGVLMFGKPFGAEDQAIFRWTILRLARRASRLLVLREIGAPSGTVEQPSEREE